MSCPDLLSRLGAAADAAGADDPPVALTTRSGQVIRLPDRPLPRTHSVDFASVRWDGRPYEFTRLQARCLRVLWDAMEAGNGSLFQGTVLALAGSKRGRLALVFRGDDGKMHPAWGTVIVPGGKGAYRLAPEGGGE